MLTAPVTAQIVGPGGVTLLARLRGQNGQLVTQASLTSISYQVSDLAAGTLAASGTFGVAATIFDGLVQNDPRWVMDSAGQPGPDGSWGYNFLAIIPASTFALAMLAANAPPAPHSYQIDVKLTPVAGEPFRFAWLVTVTPAYA